MPMRTNGVYQDKSARVSGQKGGSGKGVRDSGMKAGNDGGTQYSPAKPGYATRVAKYSDKMGDRSYSR